VSAYFVNEYMDGYGRLSGYGCYVDSLFVGCVMYVDDLLLVSASIHQLQLMVEICCSEAATLDLMLVSLRLLGFGGRVPRTSVT